MSISVIDPIGAAFNRTKLILFKPFSFEKWCVLGFCAFLAMLGDGGGAIFNIPTGPGGGGSGPSQATVDWIKANLPWLIAAAVAIAMLCMAIGLALTWLRCRGTFMFIDGIVRNRGAVIEPWKRLRTLGNSLFWFFVALSVISTTVALGIVGIAVAIALPDIQAKHFGGAALIAVLAGGASLLLFMVAMIAIAFIVEHFVIPTMYLRRERFLAAWAITRRELLAGNGGTVFLYFLMRIVVNIGLAAIAAGATCATCCLPVLPYVGSVILLPLIVFSRAYSLYFLEQFGEQWQFFPRGGPESWCMHCGYDLRATPAPGICPECGTPFGAVPPPRLAE